MVDGAMALRFEKAAFLAFELFILKRPSATTDYNLKEQQQAQDRFTVMTEKEKQQLTQNIIAGLPGGTTESSNSLASFQALLDTYKNINAAQLQANLVAFLKEIIPIAETHQTKLAIHPDDPPFSLLGLPKVMSTAADVKAVLEAVDSPNNGLCFCTGSFGARPDNNLPKMIDEFGHRINFVHLRATQRDQFGNFFEAPHLEGDVDMYEVLKALLTTQKKYQIPLAIRPDHGHLMLDDLHKKTNPGYSAIGRLRGLAELRGLELGIFRSLSEV
jgi:mannonate dehydratase